MKVGIVFSCFDLLHAGHIAMLKEEKSLCDHLIAALQVDPTVDRPTKNKPVQSVYERYIQLQACRYVDEILVYSTEADLMALLRSQKVDIRFLGSDYKDKDFTGKDWCLENGIEIYYHDRSHGFSTSELRNRIVSLQENKK